jgi:hypothetical protein
VQYFPSLCILAPSSGISRYRNSAPNPQSRKFPQQLPIEHEGTNDAINQAGRHFPS